MKYTAYTYLITCPTGQQYYGVRHAINRKSMNPDEDLWKDYFTSCKVIHEMIEEHGPDAFGVHIDKVFDTADEAIKYESQFLAENNVMSDDWVNGNIAGSVFPNPENFRKISEFHRGKPKSEDHRRKISEALKGQEHPWARDNLPKNCAGKNNGRYGKEVSEETRRKIGEANKGKTPWNVGIPISEEQKEKFKAKMKGRKRDPEAVRVTADKLRGRPRPKKQCPYCGEMVAVNVFSRWHGDNCKMKLWKTLKEPIDKSCLNCIWINDSQTCSNRLAWNKTKMRNECASQYNHLSNVSEKSINKAKYYTDYWEEKGE